MTVLPKAKKSSVNAVARQSEGRAFDSMPSCEAGFHTQYERREARRLILESNKMNKAQIVNKNDLFKSLISSDTETETLEFKLAKNGFDKNKLGKYFSALSNEANLGERKNAYLILGVDDNKQVLGCDISAQTINEYKQEVAYQTSYHLTFSNVHFIIADRGKVIILEIPAAPKGMPVAWKGHYYARNGESLTALNIEKVERIRRQNVIVDWSEKIIKDATVEDLSAEAIQFAKQEYTKKNPNLANEISTWDNIKFLNKAKICIKGNITNTAILLLGKPESEHFISPAIARITWILKDKDNIEKDYQHFSCPLLLAVNKIALKIRNLKYRYIDDGLIFPNEVDQYDSYTIREALNNCIAHQNYLLNERVNVVENENGTLTFTNAGTFIPETIQNVIEADSPESYYRNPFLTQAMVNLNMIDTIGSGIKRMFIIQKNKYFPLPDYDLSQQKIKVKITGKVIDINYARKLAELKNLKLSDIILLDKVSKAKFINDDEAKQLRQKKLIEGRKPNYIISARVASVTGDEAKYIKQRGIDDIYYMKLITDYLSRFKHGKRSDFEEMLIEKLPDVLSFQQKQIKVKNLLQKLKKQQKILFENNCWTLVDIGTDKDG